MVTNSERLAALERENAELRLRIERLEKGSSPVDMPLPEPPPAPPIAPTSFYTEPETRVFHLQIGGDFVMPNRGERQRLMRIVFAAEPWTKPKDLDDGEIETSFRASFLSLNSKFKFVDTPNHKYYGWHFSDICQMWLRTQRVFVDVAPTFAAAVLASGACWQRPDGRGNLLEFGLDEYTGRTPTDANWRGVIEQGRILPATPGRFRSADSSTRGVVRTPW